MVAKIGRYCRMRNYSYLPGTGVNVDHVGRSPRARPFHCTSVGLTLAITPNVGDSGAAFLVVGDCVRANPLLYKKRTEQDKH